ncbi:DUF3455 domain-containing protein [Betaproteobacteria bacterium PRO7]|jgi:hypothetical protein|nr:DUF3455 domain-containing protein [Betaproteobacteria bacterium PRO7]
MKTDPLMALRAALLAAALAAAGCATPVVEERSGAPDEPPAPRLGFFSRIKAPDTVQPVLQLAAAGAQIFRCEKRDDGFVWVFRQPEADLADASGRVVARHGANFSFEHVDGSRLVGTVLGFDEPPQPGNLRWLLLATRNFGEGAFAGVTHVQRVNTAGGMPPPRCEPAQSNRILRVNFTADFVFYRPR